jgi:hypothetical protein
LVEIYMTVSRQFHVVAKHLDLRKPSGSRKRDSAVEAWRARRERLPAKIPTPEAGEAS